MAEYVPEPSYAPTQPGTLAVRKAVLGSGLLTDEKRPNPPPTEQPLLDTTGV